MHNRRKEQCKDCGGASICEHNRRRNECKACGGASICEHGRQRHLCKACNEFLCTIEGCPSYGHRFAGARSLLNHMRSFHAGMPKALTKQKELVLYQDLQRAGVEFEYQKHIPFAGCGLNSETKCAYVDFTITMPWGYILLECDEDQHKTYDPSCDVRRDFDMAASVALGSSHDLLIIRYNPDSYKVGGKTRTESKKDRTTRLIALLDYEPNAFERIFLCYDQDVDSKLPLVANRWGKAARQVSRVA